MGNFEKCIPRILQYEGGYVNDPSDPGGETNFGISKRAFPNEDIKNLTKEKATAIYKKYYWDACNLDLITDASSALQIFDFAVNAGVKKSSTFAQHIVNCYTVDGIIGPLTVKLINSTTDFVAKFTEARMNYYKDIVAKRPASAKYLNGWINRAKSAHF